MTTPRYVSDAEANEWAREGLDLWAERLLATRKTLLEELETEHFARMGFECDAQDECKVCALARQIREGTK